MAQITVDMATMTDAGQNVKVTTVGDKLVLVIDLNVNLGPSSTGKMMGIGNSGGFTSLPNGLKGNIYIGKKI